VPTGISATTLGLVRPEVGVPVTRCGRGRSPAAPHDCEQPRAGRGDQHERPRFGDGGERQEAVAPDRRQLEGVPVSIPSSWNDAGSNVAGAPPPNVAILMVTGSGLASDSVPT